MEPAQGDPLGFTPPSAEWSGRGREERGEESGGGWRPFLVSDFLGPPDLRPESPAAPAVALSLPAQSCCTPGGLFPELKLQGEDGVTGGTGLWRAEMAQGGAQPSRISWGWQLLLGKQATPLGLKGLGDEHWAVGTSVRFGSLSGPPWGSLGSNRGTAGTSHGELRWGVRGGRGCRAWKKVNRVFGENGAAPTLAPPAFVIVISLALSHHFFLFVSACLSRCLLSLPRLLCFPTSFSVSLSPLLPSLSDFLVFSPSVSVSFCVSLFLCLSLCVFVFFLLFYFFISVSTSSSWSGSLCLPLSLSEDSDMAGGGAHTPGLGCEASTGPWKKGGCGGGGAASAPKAFEHLSERH